MHAVLSLSVVNQVEYCDPRNITPKFGETAGVLSLVCRVKYNRKAFAMGPSSVSAQKTRVAVALSGARTGTQYIFVCTCLEHQISGIG